MEETNFPGTPERRKDSRIVPSINSALKLHMVVENYMTIKVYLVNKKCSKGQMENSLG